MAEIIIIGSSSGVPSPDRANASFLLNAENELYQFDAGEGFSSSILRQKIDHSDIGTIFLTHGHADHFTGLFLEIQMMHLAGRSRQLSIYMPEELVEPVKKFLLTAYMFPERLGFEIIFNPVKPDPVFRDGNITVYARANSHLKQYEQDIKENAYDNKMQSYSFVIITNGAKIIYSGDIGSLSDYADILDDCGLLITEGLHLDLERLFELSAKSALKKLVLTHLSSQMYADPEPIKTLAAKYGVTDLIIAHDGLRFTV
ncbi:MAG: MBL fold metallo-hydrolase [Candidatus Zixiibacteriota bacterium]|nr:MAG: MBL fold metallo-hydrolase [candidate division Zixibacteria bacterium]